MDLLLYGKDLKYKLPIGDKTMSLADALEATSTNALKLVRLVGLGRARVGGKTDKGEGHPAG